MTRYGMLINTLDCIGCYTCRVSCQRQNGLVPTEAFIHFLDSESGTYPHVKTEVVPVQCMHCDDAPCAKACPTGATYVTDEGIVRVDQEKCIGCKYCMAACPYQARWVDDETGEGGKCTFCHHRTTHGLLPACVGTCITRARYFGDLNDPESDIAKKIAASDTDVLHADLGLDPSLHYIGLSEISEMPVVSAIHRGGNVVKTVARVNPGLCQGCGTCVAFCRSKSIDIQGYSNDQMYAEVMALLHTQGA